MSKKKQYRLPAAAAPSNHSPAFDYSLKTNLFSGIMTSFGSCFTPTSWQRLRVLGQLAVEDGIVYYYEVPKSQMSRKLRLKVAPKTLRHNLMVACHSSPFSGHSGITRTYARLSVRFWWPSIKRDVDVLVRACLHCKVGKHLSHEAQELLQELGSQGPFDVIFMDFWDPGESTPDKHLGDQKFLAIIDEMTGHVDGEFQGRGISTERLLQDVFRFFCRYGLPKIIYVDADCKSEPLSYRSINCEHYEYSQEEINSIIEWCQTCQVMKDE